MFKNIKRWWGYIRPRSATLEGWEDHKTSMKENAPIRYFFNETMTDIMCKYYYWPIRNPIKQKYERIRNRILPWRQYHIVKTGLPSDYADADHRMLHANFTLLVDFVEVECAWMKHLSDEHGDLHPKNLWQRITFRSRDMGIEYLKWQTELDDPTTQSYKNHNQGQKPPPPWSKDGHPSQAEAARQITRLYLWWKDDYLKRSDLWAEDPIRNDINTIEANWVNDEQEAISMLVKIRKSLWT